MRRCTRCILPETFPGIRLDAELVCQFCRQIPSKEHRAQQQARLRDRFESMVEKVSQRSGYHCVMAWSGGHASTYVLHILRRRYNLRVLAYTLDNGFLAPAVFQNTRRVAEHLDVDYVIVKPRFELIRRVFVASCQADLHPPRALERGSGICNSCTALIRGLGLRLVLEHNSPMLAYGWLPGQIPLASAVFHANKPMLQAMIRSAAGRLVTAGGDELRSYFPDEVELEMAESLPVNVSPLVVLPYEPDEAERAISAVGWEQRADLPINAGTCLLFPFANQHHLAERGFHPCVMELAAMVREGHLDRDVALKQLKESPANPVMRAVAVKLGLYPDSGSLSRQRALIPGPSSD